jgi:hypothetical protein
MSTLLDRLPALHDLRKGCHYLRQPTHLADELVRFLMIRRMSTKAGIDVSPGSTVDELWHWMLLNTKVRARLSVARTFQRNCLLTNHGSTAPPPCTAL